VQDEKPGVSERSTQPPETDGTENESFHRWVAETRAALARAETSRVDVYVRSLLPPPGAKESQTDLVARLADAEGRTPVDEVTVNVWGERLCHCEECRETHTGRTVLRTIRDLEAWGDATVSPFFERTTQQSSLTGNAYEGIVPPRVTVALSVEGTLQGVFPCRFAGEPFSVHDFCAVLDGVTDADAHANSIDWGVGR